MDKKKRITNMNKSVTGGGTNVFADLEYVHAEEHRAKAMLVSQIDKMIQRQRLTQTEAADRLGIDQPKVSAMLHGRFRGFSIYRLMHFVSLLGLEVNIVTRDPLQPSDVKAIAVH
jgi:predicted XRE-type DNA-binding protein